MDWDRTATNNRDKEQILNSFPAFLKQDVELVIDILPFDKKNLFSPDAQSINLDNECLKIPCRVYFDEPSSSKEKDLTEIQKVILNCIFLRHHNGFVRQRRLELLIDNTEYFVVPFVFQLLGEYVIEILFVLDKLINENKLHKYSKFISENAEYWQKTESRVISY